MKRKKKKNVFHPLGLEPKTYANCSPGRHPPRVRIQMFGDKPLTRVNFFVSTPVNTPESNTPYRLLRRDAYTWHRKTARPHIRKTVFVNVPCIPLKYIYFQNLVEPTGVVRDREYTSTCAYMQIIWIIN